MPKRILVFSTTYHPFVGGAEIAIKEITGRCSDIVFDMITLRFNSALPKFERIGNINIYRIGFATKNPKMLDLVSWPLKLNKILFPFLACLKAYSLHRKNKYDAIWAMMAAFAGFAAMLFKTINPRVKYLLTLQEGDPINEIKEKVRFVYPLFTKIFSSADCIQTISNHLADFARSMHYGCEIKVVPNAVDIKHFSQNFSSTILDELKTSLGKTASDKYLITTSRLVPKNGIIDVIQALKLLPENIKFLILGEGPDRESLQKVSKQLNLGDRVKWLGLVDHKEIPKYLKISDIFIRPSISEGLGNSFLEAMAAGLPVIATPVGGILDFLFDPDRNPDKKTTGLFCAVHDSASIAKQIERLLGDEMLRYQLIKNGGDLVREKYDWEIIAVEMKGIFGELGM